MLVLKSPSCDLKTNMGRRGWGGAERGKPNRYWKTMMPVASFRTAGTVMVKWLNGEWFNGEMVTAACHGCDHPQIVPALDWSGRAVNGCTHGKLW